MEVSAATRSSSRCSHKSRSSPVVIRSPATAASISTGDINGRASPPIKPARTPRNRADLRQVDRLNAIAIRLERRITAWKNRPQDVHGSLGRTLLMSVVNPTLTFQPTFSQYSPASPNSVGFGLSQQYDCATPIAAMRVSTNEKIMSAGDTSRIDS